MRLARGLTRAGSHTLVPEQPRASPPVPPTIEGAGAGPRLVKAMAGRPLALECVARGYPPPTLSWHHEGLPMAESNGTWLEASGGVLSLESVGEASGGLYSCVASSPAGEAMLQYAVDVQGEPRPVPPESPGLWSPPPTPTLCRPPQPSAFQESLPINRMDVYRELPEAQSRVVGSSPRDGGVGPSPALSHWTDISQSLILARVVLEIRQGTKQAVLRSSRSGGETDIE